MYVHKHIDICVQWDFTMYMKKIIYFDLSQLSICNCIDGSSFAYTVRLIHSFPINLSLNYERSLANLRAKSA